MSTESAELRGARAQFALWDGGERVDLSQARLRKRNRSGRCVDSGESILLMEKV